MMRDYFITKLVTIDVFVLIGCVYFLFRRWHISDKREIVLWFLAAGVLIVGHLIVLNGWCYHCAG